MKKLAYLLIIGIFFIFIAGCTITTSYLNVKYTPSMERGVLSELNPLTFAIKVIDERVNKELGRKKGGFGLKMAAVESNQQVEDVVKDAISEELRNNRHEVIEPLDEADIILRTMIEEFSVNTHMGVVTQKLVGTIIINIRAIIREKDETIYSNTYNGNYTSNKFLSTTAAYEDVMNKTLANFMVKFNEDRGFVEALKKYQKEI